MRTSEATFPALAVVALFMLCGMAPAAGQPVAAPAGVETKAVRFAKGAKSATVADSVIRGERSLYTIAANRGQNASLRITSVENNAVFAIYEPGAKPTMQDGMVDVAGKTLPGADEAKSWSGTLPSTGTYLIVVGGTRGNATFRLSVGID